MSAVATLLRDKKRWLHKGYAQDANGRECKKATDARVCKWSLVAAIRACYSDDDVLPVQRRVRQALAARGWEKPICCWNHAERRTHKEVMALAEKLGI